MVSILTNTAWGKPWNCWRMNGWNFGHNHINLQGLFQTRNNKIALNVPIVTQT